jgi:hypothetical protein
VPSPIKGCRRGILPKWVTANDRGTFDARAKFAGRVIDVLNRLTTSEAFRAVLRAIEKIRAVDGPLPPGVADRAGGYVCRFWSNNGVRVEYGPFALPREAAGYAGHIRASRCSRVEVRAIMRS